MATAVRRRPTLRSALALLLLLALAAAGCAQPRDIPGDAGPVVIRVVDGDTVVVALGGQEEVVRLLGVDTPETVHPTQPPGCFGAEAAGFTGSLLPEGTAVRLERDVEERDAYGRLLAYVHRADGTFVNHELVAGGYATVLVLAPNGAYAGALRQAERQARAAGAGLWGRCGQ